MKFDIRTQGFELTDALSEHVHRRMIFALHRFHHRLGQRATVHLSDENGPKGGVDMRCVIHVPMPGRKEVVIREDGDDLYVAIDRAADRMGRTVARRLERSQEPAPLRQEAEV
ncbi:MAG: ribosomal subunit interface protein [Methylophilales bacterium RIFCSPHIGHO2_02_FULL_57_10]|nr:MAG: ribosomal subunit interface protein [Methylophilales bacterium RIFCSPHIGHO2_02_FULL_57_10]